MPGHKGGSGAPRAGIDLLGAPAYAADLSEMGGFDYLHGPTSAMRAAQERAAVLFGATRSWFLVNGATVGNLAALCALVGEGDGVLLQRNAHRSVYAGLALSGARPHYLSPIRDELADGFFGIDPDEVAQRLAESSDITAVHLTSPSYYGFASDVEKVAQICAERRVLLIVDEAHGTHFRFHPSFSRSALEFGADVVVQSPHKTLGSLTQSSLLHCQGSLVDADRLDASLQMLQSSSPSALLTVSLDLCLEQMQTEGPVLWGRALELAALARERLSGIDGLLVYGPKSVLPRGITDLDLTKLVVDVSGLLLSAPEVGAQLQERCGVFAEFSDLRRLVFLLTFADNEDSIELLCSSLAEICASAPRTRDRRELSSLWPDFVPRQAFTPREAMARDSEVVPVERAAGRIAAEMVVPYPPGIPLVVPGEELSDAVLAAMAQIKAVGSRIVGVADDAGTSLRCLI